MRYHVIEAEGESSFLSSRNNDSSQNRPRRRQISSSKDTPRHLMVSSRRTTIRQQRRPLTFGSTVVMQLLLVLLLSFLTRAQEEAAAPPARGGLHVVRTATTTTAASPTSVNRLPTLGPIGDNAHCNIEDLEVANDSQLHSILVDLTQTSFFRNFVVDLDTKCPLRTWRTKSQQDQEDQEDADKAAHATEETEEEDECSKSSLAAAELDVGAQPLCTVEMASEEEEDPLIATTTTTSASLDSNALNTLFHKGKFQSQAQKDTFAWNAHSDLVVQDVSAMDDPDCEGTTFDQFWMDMCSSIASTNGKTVNLQLNPERNTGYNGTHIWKAIYEENCLAAGDMCLEERVLYRMLSGLHTSTTLSIAVHYYPPSQRKQRTTWEPNPGYFMNKFEHHPEHLRNLHFAYVVLLRAVRKATPFLKAYEIRTGNIVEDETATILLNRLLDSAVLKSCSHVFDAFDESLLWKSKDITVQQNFKGVFHNVSSILDCVQCQQCKLHGKMTMLGYGAALKVLFMQQPVLERNEIVALINTIAKFSESLRHIRELTNLYWRQHNTASTSSSSTLSSASAAATATATSTSTSASTTTTTDLVDQTVQAVATLGRQGRIDWPREAELVQLAMEQNDDLLLLTKHYSTDLDKFLYLTSQLIHRGGGAGSAITSSLANTDPDAVIVGSGLAGLSAALTLLDRGGRVVIVEKEHLLGGNSNKASSGINGCCLPDEVNATHDTLDLFRNDTTRSAGTSAQPELIETLVTKSATALTWLKTRVGVDLSLLSQLGGHSTKRTHRPSNGMAGAEIIYHLSKAVRAYEKTGHVQILVDTKVTGLVTTADGRVVGVKAAQSLKPDSSEFEIRADNVVLATGGFAADRSSGSFLEQYRPELLNMPATAGAFSTGDGVSLATALGAGTVDMDKVQIHPTGWVDPSDPDNTSKVLAAELMRGVGGVLLNDHGQRFCNELGTRAYVVDKMLSHDPMYATTKKWNATSKIPTFHLVLSSSAAADGKKHVDLYTHKGLMTQIKGVTALAKHTGMSKSALVQTFTQYQQDAINGMDAFGKTSFRGVPHKDLESEIFYVGTITPVLHYCMGGITIDAQGNVLKENGDKIPGLHAAGEVTGGVHGVNRLGGNSLLECTVYGTLIGQKLPMKASQTQAQQGVPSSATASSSSSELRPVTLAELNQHNTPDDCWIAIQDFVYDLTAFAEEHPAGPQSIHELAGKDGTEAFAAVHNEGLLEDFLEDRIGRLVL